MILDSISTVYPHPSHRPNRLNSRRMHSRPGFSSLSRSLPLSGRLVNEDPLDDLGRCTGIVLTLGGEVDSGYCTDGAAPGEYDEGDGTAEA